jgi:hypothetical protein
VRVTRGRPSCLLMGLSGLQRPSSLVSAYDPKRPSTTTISVSHALSSCAVGCAPNWRRPNPHGDWVWQMSQRQSKRRHTIQSPQNGLGRRHLKDIRL